MKIHALAEKFGLSETTTMQETKAQVKVVDQDSPAEMERFLNLLDVYISLAQEEEQRLTLSENPLTKDKAENQKFGVRRQIAIQLLTAGLYYLAGLMDNYQEALYDAQNTATVMEDYGASIEIFILIRGTLFSK